MARTNIEETTFSKLSKFAGRLGWSEREALGLLVMLWHDSQEEEAVLATKEDVFDYCRLYSETNEEKEKVLNALLKSKFIIIENNKYRIRGNESQVAVLAAYRERTKNATKARLEKISGKKIVENEKSDVDDNVDVTSTSETCNVNDNMDESQGNAKQCNAMQSNAMQSDSIQKVFNEISFERIKSLWKKAAGHGAMGSAEKKLGKIIKEKADLDNFIAAIENYGEVQKIKTWRDPKSTLANFIGVSSKTKSFYYLDYIDPCCVEEARTSESRKNSKNKEQKQNNMLNLYKKAKEGKIS